MKGQFHFISRRWQSVSPAAKKFVTELLQKNPDKRPTAVEALASPWLNNRSENGVKLPEATLMMDQVQATIQR